MYSARDAILAKKKKDRITQQADPLAEGFKQHAQASGYPVQTIPAGEPLVRRPAVPSAQPQQPIGGAMPWAGAMALTRQQRPMQAPSTSPRPEVPEQTTAAAPPQPGDPQAELRNRILMKNREREINSKRMALGMTSAYGPDGQINMDRADTLRSMGDELDAVRGSMAPIQKPQTPEQVMSARTNIREQGMGQVAVMRKRAFEADKAGDAATAQKLYDEARRMEVAFRSSFPDHSPEAAQEIVGRQEQGAERAANQRGAYGELAAAQGNDGESLMKQKIQARERQAKINQMLQSRDESMIGGDIRENQMRGRSPVPLDVSATQAELQNTELKTRLADAKEQGRIADIRRTSGGQVTHEDMQLGQNPGSVLPQFDGSFKALKSAFGGGFTGTNRDTLYAGNMVSGNSAADLQKIPVHVNQMRKLTDRIISLSKVDPAGASRAAMYMLARMPERGRDGQYDAARSFLGFGSNVEAAEDIVDQLNFIVADLGTLIQSAPESAG
jgi:hypothetical protein